MMNREASPVAQVLGPYYRGIFQEAIDAVKRLIKGDLSREDHRRIVVISAWCHCHLRQYDLAETMAKLGLPNDEAKECLQLISALVRKDEGKLLACAERSPWSVSIQTELVVAARAEKSKIGRANVLRAAESVQADDGILGAHLVLNIGRYLMDKKEHMEDLVLAASFIKWAIAQYRLHDAPAIHIASAYSLLSLAVEEAHGKDAARKVAEKAKWLLADEARRWPRDAALVNLARQAEARYRELASS